MIEDREDYIQNAYEHLNNPTVYQELDNDDSEKHKQIINQKLERLHTAGLIQSNWFEYCKPPKKHRTSRLYFLKKIHKNPMSIRPIVSSCNSITENISKFIDTWLQPYVQTLPSFIKDTTDFINLLETTALPEDCILASIDVTSLYTNIPHEDGIEYTIKHIENHPDNFKHPEQPSATILRELMNIVLKNNIFEFNNKYYIQKQGTAMGTRMAPSYANLFMGTLETELVKQNSKNIQIWKRFIDDIFIIWTGTLEEFQEFMNKINQIHPTIKFTHEVSKNELTILDVTVYKGDRFQTENKLDIKTHIKKTNKQLYVHESSYHPKSTKKAIMKGETIRYLRTNSNKSNFDKMKTQLIHKLKQRGYKQNHIMKQMEGILHEDRAKTLTRKVKPKDTHNQILVTNYSDDIPRIKEIIRKHWKIIQKDPKLNLIFKAPPLIATRNSHSLRNKLVRAKLPTEDTERESNDTTLNPDTAQPTSLPDEYPICLFNKTSQNFRNPITRCTKNCIICKMLATNLFARSTSKKTKHQTTLPPEDQHYNCKSKNVIYLATCNYKNCAAQYIGYTTRSLRDRIYEHLQTNTSAIYKHCNQLHHPLQKVKFQILTQAPKDTK